MQYDKKLQDEYGDDIRVEGWPEHADGDRVFLTVSDATAVAGDNVAALTPDAARTLARYLKRAANVAEGKPAKTPKSKLPASFVDGEGDTWYRDGNRDSYTLGNDEDDGYRSHAYTGRSRDFIRENHSGIREERP